MTNEPKKMLWLSAAEVARRWGVVTATVVNHIDDGSLEAVNIARRGAKRRRWRISEKAMSKFEASRCSN